MSCCVVSGCCAHCAALCLLTDPFALRQEQRSEQQEPGAHTAGAENAVEKKRSISYGKAYISFRSGTHARAWRYPPVSHSSCFPAWSSRQPSGTTTGTWVEVGRRVGRVG